MSSILKVIKRFLITIFLFGYFTIIMFFSILLLNKNEFGLTQFGDKVLVNITNDNSTNKYKNGDLVILNKVKLKNIKVDDEIFVYRVDSVKNTVSIVISDVSKVVLDESSEYVILKNDNLSWGEKYIAGMQTNIYGNIGAILNFFQSKWVFFFLLIVPCFVILLYHIFLIIVNIKYDNRGIKRKSDLPINNGSSEEELKKELAELQQQAVNLGVVENLSVDNTSIENLSVDNTSVESLNSEETGNNNFNEPVITQVIGILGENQELIVENNNVEMLDFDNFSSEEAEELEEIEDDEIEELDMPFMYKILPTDDIEDEILNKLSHISIDVDNSANLAEITNVTPEEEQEVLAEEEKKPNEQEDVEKEKKVKQIEEIGKNEINFVKKILLIKEKEVMEFVKLIYERTGEKTPVTVVKRMVTYYIKDKYIVPIDFTNESLKYKEQLLVQNIKNYPNKIKNINAETKNKVVKALLIYNEFDKNYDNLNKVIAKYFNNSNEEEMKLLIGLFNDKIKKYKEVHREFVNKISSKMFELELEETKIKNVYNTKICSNLKFSKIFSEYIINKSYHENVVLEQLEEVQLKLISALLLQQILDFDFVKKYLIFFNDSVYTKERRLKTLLNNIDDPFSQAKVLILLNKDIIIQQYDLLKKLKAKGYHFALEVHSLDIKNDEIKKNNLLLCDYIFIIDKLTEEEKTKYIPVESKDCVFFVESPVIETVVIK